MNFKITEWKIIVSILIITLGINFISATNQDYCKKDSDCKIISNNCGCIAVLKSDERDKLDDEPECLWNNCMRKAGDPPITAICKDGTCIRSDKEKKSVCPNITRPVCENDEVDTVETDANGCAKKLVCFNKSVNNTNTKVKILPEVASQRAKERLGELGFNVTLKEIGNNKTVYEVSGEKQGKIFGLFNVMGKVSVDIDAETGDVIKMHKPWWSLLAGI
jgi:hypothetical protein